MTALKQFVEVLKKTQWMPADELAAYQRKPLGKLLWHAYQTVPFYRDRLAVLFRKNGSIDWNRWEEVPFLTKSDIQIHADDLTSRDIPARHGDITITRSSGSTGEPVEVKGTMFHRYTASAIAERLNDWHQIDHTLKLASIRPQLPGYADYPDGRHEPSWVAYADYQKNGGSHSLLNSTVPIHLQFEWLSRAKRDYLHIFPSAAEALAEFAMSKQASGKKVSLAGILTTGETATQSLRIKCREAFDAEIVDIYSTSECGYLGLECPDAPGYHVPSEVVLVEVLDRENRQCRQGETGHVVATPFNNYAMPLIRYKMNDHAVAGETCSCGRSLPVLSEIVGRTRSLFRFPDGTVVSPNLRSEHFLKNLKPRQWQVAQTGPLQIEVRLVPHDRNAEMEFDAMTAFIKKALRSDLSVSYVLLDEILLKPGGKHEDYICELA